MERVMEMNAKPMDPEIEAARQEALIRCIDEATAATNFAMAAEYEQAGRYIEASRIAQMQYHALMDGPAN